MKKETWITIGICCVFLVLAGGVYLRGGSKRESNVTQGWEMETVRASPKVQSEVPEIAESKLCTVYVCGAVKSPGVYSLSEGSRVCDAIKAAGGLKKVAEQAAVNQARLLVDGEQITIPVRNTNNQSEARADSDKININSATKEELMTLSGIGETKAQMIIAFREENGPFDSIEDIMKISGIKEGVYNQIKENITV